MKMRVRYKTKIQNPNYKYGDQGKPSRLTIEGVGYIVHYYEDLDLPSVLLYDIEDGQFHVARIHEITELQSREHQKGIV